MSNDRIEGAVREGVGRVQDAAGGLFGNSKTEMRGKLNQAAGSAQNAYGQVKDQASDALDQARDQFSDIYDEVEAYVRDQPMAALAIGAGVGLVLGLLMRGGRKVVYVRK
jgi:uncharacterized protein YjbJ (UPF0337 family)